jgi:hypothetical protein
MVNEMLTFVYEVSFIVEVFLTCLKIYDMGPTALFSFRRKSFYGFLSPFKITSSSAGSELANLKSNGKHANHETTERGVPGDVNSYDII